MVGRQPRENARAPRHLADTWLHGAARHVPRVLGHDGGAGLARFAQPDAVLGEHAELVARALVQVHGVVTRV